ncbi:MAG: ABC transporter permease [Dysgonamonadaceae bacterium]|jgi:hypothetical protein|nr:ABC transporter permease [Dysgonamonadaceae bacterium]
MRNSFIHLKLLRQNVSPIQAFAYFIASLTGVIVLLAGFCFSQDIRPLFRSGEGGISRKELFTINKQVKSGIWGKSNTAFTEKEIEEISRQPFVRSTHRFMQSHFEVYAWINFGMGQTNLGTEMFFESVPDECLENLSPEWRWDVDGKQIPILIPRDYVNLYNFGFAGSQGLPQISEGLMREITFNVRLTGNGLQEIFKGRIAGFSTDLNTILVPETFLRWANSRFGENDDGKTTRIIVEVKNPADMGITEFFASKPDYVIARNKGESGKLAFFLNLLISAILAVGAMILLPSTLMMILSINLLIYKSEKILGNLLLLGYRRWSLIMPYCAAVIFLNLSVGGFGLWIVSLVQSLYEPRLRALGIDDFSGSFTATAIFALLFMLSVSLLDILWIKRKINNILTTS